MFWSLMLKANYEYFPLILHPLHLSQAALDVHSCSEASPVQVLLITKMRSIVLCTLRLNSVEQVPLDLNFQSGAEISFACHGPGDVYLTGYYLVAFNNPHLTRCSLQIDELDHGNAVELSSQKREKSDKVIKTEIKIEESSEDEHREEPKRQKLGIDVEKEKQSKKGNKDHSAGDKQKGVEKSLLGGVEIEDIKVGVGVEAKIGKKVNIHYVMCAKPNNKKLDSCLSGKGFSFCLGRGEVILGWDIGIPGMKVGGKRKIICPPHTAYGPKGSLPVIPPNSTLEFEVTLRQVE